MAGHVIVLGNEKGGSGKSTTAMHIIVALLKQKRTVAAIDLDARQGTLTRYLENRAAYQEAHGTDLVVPDHIALDPGDEEFIEGAVADLKQRHDIVVIDCPGTDTELSRRGHALADTLVTPLNDSFVDFDVLGTVDQETLTVTKPSHYAEMVWEQRKRRVIERRPPIDWVVMRNRLAALDARNKQMVGQALNQLAKRAGFRLAPGFGERVIFRELFPKGLTLMDLRDEGADAGLTVSNVAARQEVRSLITALNLPAPPLAPASAATETGDMR